MNIEEVTTSISNINITNNNNNNILQKNNENRATATTLNQTQFIKNGESQIEYSLCGLFSIMYPFSLNFEQSNLNDSDKESLIPKLGENPPSWYDLTEQSESLETLSSSSSLDYHSDCDMSDISSSTSSSTSSLFSTSTNNHKNNPNNNTVPKQKIIIKKLFIGGIKFDDLSNDPTLKSKRIQKLTQLFHSFGKIDKFDPHWEKGYLFIHYLNPKVSQKVFTSFSNPSKKLKIIQNIKESLKNENIDVKCAPTTTIYVRFPTNNKKS